MLSQTLRHPSFALSAFAAVLPLFMGCGTHQVDSGDVSIHIETEDGRTQAATVGIDETLANAPFESLDILDAAPGETFVFPAVTLERTERGLRVIEQVEGLQVPAEVTWSEDLSTLTVAGSVETTISLEGSNARRPEFVAYAAADALGASLPGSEFAEEPDVVISSATVVIISLAALGLIGYVACITSGSDRCNEAAQDNCSNGVDEYKVICGAGTDVNGEFRLGYVCSFRCN